MPLSNKEVCAILFTTSDQDTFTCSACDKSYKSSNGYSNLMNHLRRTHPSFEEDARQAARQRNALQLRLVDDRTRDIYRWCEWVITERLPFDFVERPLVRLNARMTTICKETLMAYIDGIARAMEASVAAALPATFGLVLDGWSNNGRHFIGVFAVFRCPGTTSPTRTVSPEYYDDLECNDRHFVLLAFCPVEEEEDMSAQSLFDLIADTLSRYNKPWESVAFMVGDNCSVNQYIGRREGAIPLIGCASHRFNLAVRDFLKDDEPLMGKIQTLMLKLRTIKGRALLRRVTKLSPVLRSDTRWSSSFEMLKRYVVLEPLIGSLGHGVLEEYDIQPLLLRRSENDRARALLNDLRNFEGVTKTLQQSNLTLSGVRRLFDHAIASYPLLKQRLAPSAPIVNFPNLESGLVKVQRREPLSHAERLACAAFKQQGEREEVRSPETSTFVADAFKRRKVTKRAGYMDVLFVPPTSNECERFFSSVKLVYSDLRKSMDIATLEKVMLLRYNADFWDVYTVERVRSAISSRNAR